MFSVRPQKFFSSVEKFFRLLQNRVQATHLFLKDDDLGWGAPGLGDDLGWGGEVTRDALGLLESDINILFLCRRRRPPSGGAYLRTP